jgi:uncharacterized protein (DUF983 family)
MAEEIQIGSCRPLHMIYTLILNFVYWIEIKFNLIVWDKSEILLISALLLVLNIFEELSSALISFGTIGFATPGVQHYVLVE